MDISKVLLQKEDDAAFYLHHPERGQFSVAKHGLKDSTIKHIQGLQKYADGGEVESPENAADKSPETAAVAAPESPGSPTSATAQEIDPGISKALSQLENPQPGDFIPPPKYADVGPTPPDVYTKSQDLLTEQGELAQKQAEAQARDLQFMASELQRANARRDEILAEKHKLLLSREQAMADNKIDPNRVWHTMGTGNKILAAISIALGGISQGILKTATNPAMDVINKTIDSDIEAQKANAENAKNLFSLKLEEYNNLEAAEAATRADMLSGIKVMMEQRAALAKGPEAKINAQKAIIEVEKEKQKQLELAADAKMMQEFGGTKQQTNIPLRLQDRVVRLRGKPVAFVSTKEEKAKLQDSITELDQINTDLDQLESLISGGSTDFGTAANRIPFTDWTLFKTDHAEKIDNLRQSIALHYKNAFHGKESEESYKKYLDLAPDIRKVSTKDAAEDIRTARKKLQQQINTELKNKTLNFSEIKDLERPPKR